MIYKEYCVSLAKFRDLGVWKREQRDNRKNNAQNQINWFTFIVENGYDILGFLFVTLEQGISSSMKL